jgi:anti-anti-sigma regulatory factor
MLVKTDTKEKFTVITPEEAFLSANMADEFKQLLGAYLTKEPRHLVLNMSAVKDADTPLLVALAETQQYFYENNASFVICALQQALEAKLEAEELLELLNATPTESEAWDIVQMEEIERELFDE